MALCFLAMVPEAGAFKIRSALEFGEKYVYLADVAKYYGLSLNVGKQAVRDDGTQRQDHVCV